MSAEAMKQAIEAWDACGRYPDATSDIERLDVAINALRSALAQQPATGEPVVQAGLTGDQLREAFAEKLSDIDPNEHDMTIFALGAEVGAGELAAERQMARMYFDERNSARDAWRRAADERDQLKATGEPVVSRNPFASRCYTMSESHLSGHRLIVGFEKLGDAQDAHEWVARQGRGDFTRPAPSVTEPVAWLDEMLADMREVFDANGSETPQVVRDVIEYVASWVTVYREKNHPAPSVLKDDQIAALVNKVRDIARMFHDHQSLRERIAIELVPALKASQEVKSNAERWRYAIADGGNQSMNFIDIFGDWDGDGDFVEVFDAARLADK